MTKKRILAILMTAVIALTLFAACTSQPPPSGSTTSSSSTADPGSTADSSSQPSESAPTGAAEPLTFTMLANYQDVEPPQADMEMFKFLKEKLNTVIDISWVPTDNHNEMLAARISANDMPNVVTVRDPKLPVVIQAARAGMFWPLDPYINDAANYPSFDKLNKDVLRNASVDGVVYTLTREREPVRAGVLWRQDWLEKVGLEEPKNMEDIFEICRAFTEDDPDGNGIDDTTGMLQNDYEFGNMATVTAVYYGGVKFWGVDESGNFFSEYETPEYKMALDFYRELYTNGYMVSDFAVLPDFEVPFKAGKGGLSIRTTVADVNNLITDTQEVFPEATAGATMEIFNPAGEITIYSHTGHNGVIMFPKTTTETEEELLPILAFFNELGKPENTLVMNNGYEGTHYTLTDGFITKTPEQQAQFRLDFLDQAQINPYSYNAWWEPSVKEATPLRQKIEDQKLQFATEATLIYNPADPFVSDTMVAMGANLTNIVADARLRYVIGEVDWAYFENAVAEWKAAGGDQVAAEYSAAYQAVNG